MELSKTSYDAILQMPVKRLEDYLDWKIKHDQDREKAKSDSLSQLNV